MIIQASLFGAIADRNQWEQFSCIRENGTLDRRKYAEYMRIFANDGANATREIPFLVTDKDYDGTAKQRNFLPFKWRDGKYDLAAPNPIYFENLKEMIKIANRHNMAFQVSIFDRCHSLNMPDSPWNLNHQGIKGYYDWNLLPVTEHVFRLINAVRQADKELQAEGFPHIDILWELENEPVSNRFIESGTHAIQLLLEQGFRKDQIEWGCYYLPGQSMPVVSYKGNGELERDRVFVHFLISLRKRGLFVVDEKNNDNRNYFATIHNFGANPEVWQEMIEAVPHSHRMSLSDDGEKVKPGADEWYHRLLPIFQSVGRRPHRRKNLDRWKIEHLYRGDLQGKSMFNDDMHGTVGISEAYFGAFKEWPENYNRFPEAIHGPNPDHGAPGNEVAEPGPGPVPGRNLLDEAIGLINEGKRLIAVGMDRLEEHRRQLE